MEKIIKFIKKHKYILLLILLYGFMFFQMQNVFLYGDDFDVTYPIYYDRNNIMDIFRFCIDQVVYFWYEWSGRFVGHFIVSFGLSMFGIQFFRLLNPIMVFLLIFLSLKILKFFVKFNFNKMLFWLSFIFIGVNAHLARETLYWAYGGILYIWGFVLFLIIVYNIYKYYLQDKKIPIFMLLLFILLSVIQVFMLEQLSFMLLAFFGIMAFILKKNNKKNFIPILILLIATLVSFAIFLTSPGNVGRTEPLVNELANYSNFQIVLSKLSNFFNFLFNPKTYGVYFMGFFMLVAKKYISMMTKKDKFIKKIPLLIFFSYFIIVITNCLFDINILAFFEDFDALYLLYHNNNVFYVLLIDIYYILLTLSVTYMFYKTINKKNKFLLLSFIITFLASAIPIVCIRYTGTRYFLFLFVDLLILILYYIFDLKEKSIDLKTLFLLLAIIPNKYLFAFLFLILCLVFIFEKLIPYLQKYHMMISIVMVIVILSVNCIDVFIGYKKNSEIHIMNNDLLLARRGWDIINIFEIPYEDCLYSWHVFSMDYNGYKVYYDFYLDEFYESYYGIDSEKICIINGGDERC